MDRNLMPLVAVWISRTKRVAMCLHLRLDAATMRSRSVFVRSLVPVHAHASIPPACDMMALVLDRIKCLGQATPKAAEAVNMIDLDRGGCLVASRVQQEIQRHPQGAAASSVSKYG